MKRWTITVVAMVSALALIATPALAANQTRSQDKTCTERPAECDPIEARACEQNRAQAKTQDRTQDRTQAKAQDQVQERDPAQEQAQTRTATHAQAQTRVQAQAGKPNAAADTPELAQRFERFQKKHAKQNSKQCAKRANTITSSD